MIGILRKTSFVVGLLAPLSLTAVRAETRAIVIGFDDYGVAAKLHGAVADSEDISSALERRGVHDRIVMTDPSLHAEDFWQRWKAMIARSQPGDLVIVTFAGHGMEVRPEKRQVPPGHEEGFLFPSFDDSKRTDELLRKTDLYDRFKAAASVGIRILFIADACFSGGGIRDVDPRRGGGGFRFNSFTTRGDESPPPATPIVRAPIPLVVSIGAQQPDKAVPELQIDGRLRGALSYSFARALDGAAATTNGDITLDSLWAFIGNDVRVRSDNAQVANHLFRDEDRPMVLFAVRHGTDAPRLPPSRDLAVYTLGYKVPLRDAFFTEVHAEADLTWDPRRRQVVGTMDVLASDVDDAHLQGAVDARRLVLFLRDAAERIGNLAMSVRKRGADPNATDNDRNYEKGTSLELAVQGAPPPFVTVLDVNGNGETQLLFPLNKAEQRQTDISFQPEVGAPFGGDFVVAIRSEAPLSDLWPIFDAERKAPADRVLATLERLLGDRKARIGIQGIFTCDKFKGKGHCDDQH